MCCTVDRAVVVERTSGLSAIPHEADRRIGVARPETAAIVASAEEAGFAEIVPIAIIPVAWDIGRPVTAD